MPSGSVASSCGECRAVSVTGTEGFMPTFTFREELGHYVPLRLIAVPFVKSSRIERIEEGREIGTGNFNDLGALDTWPSLDSGTFPASMYAGLPFVPSSAWSPGP